MRVSLDQRESSQPRWAAQRQAPLVSRAALARALGAALGRVDAGWLYLAAGLMLLASVALIPAQVQLAAARAARDRAAATADYELDRLRRASDFLDQLRAGEPGLLEALALDQLRQAPAGKTALEPYVRPAAAGGPLTWIEPASLAAPTAAQPLPTSTLARLATNDRARLVTMALAAALVFAGLLPPATGRSGDRCTKPSKRRQRPPGRCRGALRMDLTGSRWRRAGSGPRRTPGCSR